MYWYIHTYILLSHSSQKVIIQDVLTTHQGQTKGLFSWGSKLWFR